MQKAMSFVAVDRFVLHPSCGAVDLQVSRLCKFSVGAIFLGQFKKKHCCSYKLIHKFLNNTLLFSSRCVVWKLLGKAKIFMTARWISIQRVLPQMVHFKTIESRPLHIFRWMVPRHLSYCLAWYRIRGTLDVLRSPWYNLDVCRLTNPMSAY